MLEKIRDIPKPCYHPEHNPPTMIVLEPGVYRHTCPQCGHVTEFSVQGYSWSTGTNLEAWWVNYTSEART